MKSSTSGLATITLALATALGVSVAGPHRAYAAPAPTAQLEDNLAITVLSPTPHASFGGNKPIEVSAFYQGSDSNAITSIELYVDGTNAFTKKLEAPEARGVISFLIDTSQLTAGSHAVVVRAVAADAEVVSAKSSFIYVAERPAATEVAPPTPTASPSEASLPRLSYVTPSVDEKVSGTVKISLKASEDGGKAPYVSVFIDRAFKTLRNYAPYEYDWDTTSYTNGYHTIEAYGYDESQNVGPAQVMRVYVNNPGGRTDVRTDLKDGSPAPIKPLPLAPAKPKSPASALSAPIAHRLTSRSPMLIATRLPALNGIDIGEVGLSSPFIPASHGSASAPKAAGTPTSTKMSSLRRLPAASLRVAKLDTVTGGIDRLSDSELSDPFVTTTGTAIGAKSRAISRRPAPVLARDMSVSHVSTLRPVMMAKRSELLDQTGGLHPDVQLSDPFVPETASPKPASHSHTPTTGFKPLPSTGSANAPVLATAQPKPQSPGLAPSMITRDAHTLPVHLSAPALTAPVVDVATPIAKPKPVMLHSAAPATPAVTVKAAVPAAQPAKVQVLTPLIHHKVVVHTGGVETSLLRAKGQMKVIFNHTTLRLDRPLTPHAGVMFSPLRQIFEYEGGALTWERATGVVRATTETKDIRLKIGDRKAEVNNKTALLELAPYLDEGRTMVPLSFLTMALDVNVHFDPATGHLLVTSKE